MYSVITYAIGIKHFSTDADLDCGTEHLVQLVSSVRVQYNLKWEDRSNRHSIFC